MVLHYSDKQVADFAMTIDLWVIEVTKYFTGWLSAFMSMNTSSSLDESAYFYNKYFVHRLHMQ